MLPQSHRVTIIKSVKIQHIHDWQISIGQAREIQQELSSRISRKNEVINPSFIVGVDISAPDSSGIARAAVVVLNYPELEIIEVKITEGKLSFPYIPGFLSFRETPLVLAACQKLSSSPDLVMVDGQGVAHPRRFGLASHVGLLLDTPTIGCAKSRLCGRHKPLGAEAGSYANLTDNDEIIGAALRTKVKVNPVYVSIGHKTDLPTAMYYVMECCNGYRLPEPSRLAHLAAGGKSLTKYQGRQQKIPT